MSSTKLAIVLAMAAAIGPFSLDTYLPTFPNIIKDLHAGYSELNTSVTIYIIGVALGQLICGSLSDYFGRKKIMLIGLIIFSLASFLLAGSNNPSIFLFWRLIQGFATASVTVNVPAIVRDRIERHNMAKTFSVISSMIVIAPAIAPLIGILINKIFNWRYIFVLLALYAWLLIFLLQTVIFKSNHDAPQILKKKFQFFPGYLNSLKSKRVISLILLQGLNFGILIVFLTNSSFIYQQKFGISQSSFGLILTITVISMGLFGIFNRILLEKFSAVSVLTFASVFQMLLSLFLVSLIFIFHAPFLLFMLSVVLLIGTIGTVSPNIQAIYFDLFEKNISSASALMGVFQLIIAASMSAISVFFTQQRLEPIMLTMAFGSILSFILVFKVIR